MSEPRDLHRSATSALSTLMLVIGVAMIISTIARGGGPLAIGVVFGLLFVIAGAGRLYVSRKAGP